jgi:phage protein D
LSLSDQEGQGSRLRTPFFSVFLNKNDILTGVESFEVTNASHFAADTFRLTAAVGKLPPDLGPAYWGSSVGDQLEINAGFKDQTGQGTAKSLIYGQVDDVEYDPVGRSITLTGRDLSAVLIDTKTATSYQDQTASQVVQTIAKEHALTASVKATTTKVGTYYELYNLHVTKDQAEWDLLMFLAEREGFDLWVSGQTINFQPPVPLNTDPYVLQWSDQGQGNRVANFETIKLHRSQTLAKDVVVTIKSFNQAQGKNVTAISKRSQANKSQRVGGQAQLYTYYEPNLSQQAAQQLANSRAEEITRHERVITGTLPGDNLLTNRSLIKLVGTATEWDQLYFVDSVTRKMSFRDGYSMEFRAKNHSPQSTV